MLLYNMYVMHAVFVFVDILNAVFVQACTINWEHSICIIKFAYLIV